VTDPRPALSALTRVQGVVLGLLVLLVLGIMGAMGALRPWITPDTAGYLASRGWPTMLAVERPPFYRWLLEVLTIGGAAPGLVAVAQVALYLAAGAWLLRCLSVLGLPGRAIMAVGITLALANVLLLIANWVHPEFPAISCALFALGAALRATLGVRFSWRYAAIAMAAGGAAYLLRPSFLPLIFAFPLVGLLWRMAALQPARPTRAALLVFLLLLPFLSVASLRWTMVRDFNIVSFGGFQMSGLAALALAPEVLPRLPPDARALAEDVLAARMAAEADGRIIGIPANSSGTRSFASAALGYFDVLARTHDDVLYGIVRPQQRQGEDWVAFNARMQRWSLAVMLATPDRYAAWIVGASSRLVGRALVTNLPFVLGVLALLALIPLTWLRRVRPGPAGAGPDRISPVTALSLLAVGWLAATGPLIVLTTFPASRYIDTAGLLLAAPIWFLVLERGRLLGMGTQPERRPPTGAK